MVTLALDIREVRIGRGMCRLHLLQFANSCAGDLRTTFTKLKFLKLNFKLPMIFNFLFYYFIYLIWIFISYFSLSKKYPVKFILHNWIRRNSPILVKVFFSLTLQVCVYFHLFQKCQQRNWSLQRVCKGRVSLALMSPNLVGSFSNKRSTCVRASKPRMLTLVL